ncbi:MAG TPA: SET domain-containing protein-lysine N-methyltransferase [Candidatus Limnocylindria bacterium]|jgi:SET domain-containing protein|nr:SET domain-containing protein-lysine N-methyltransferase [Candidatus Limnocylindria bacterium]
MSDPSPPVEPKPYVARFAVLDSSIQGRGAFAMQPFEAGERIVIYGGERISKAESLRRCEAGNPYIFALDDRWDLDGNQADNPARFFNHSCRPNCEAQLDDGEIWIVALRDIRPGEELNFDYGYGLEEYRGHPCCCGAPGCCGYIVAERFREEVLQQEAGRPELRKLWEA